MQTNECERIRMFLYIDFSAPHLYLPRRRNTTWCAQQVPDTKGISALDKADLKHQTRGDGEFKGQDGPRWAKMGQGHPWNLAKLQHPNFTYLGSQHAPVGTHCHIQYRTLPTCGRAPRLSSKGLRSPSIWKTFNMENMEK